jgi:2-polyprenyl-3-methyl-5-hydroxy-6-metoxy-1,4-benzoquinol methylase
MPKKVRFEAFKYRFLVEAESLTITRGPNAHCDWELFLEDLSFQYDSGNIIIKHPLVPCLNETIWLNTLNFYTRGDAEIAIKKQAARGLMQAEDKVQIINNEYFHEIIKNITKKAGFELSNNVTDRIKAEKDFHDDWAASEDLAKIDVCLSNEACTAPEMRFITESLGDLKGKSVLDLGCGLGEVSVYFATLGADVTASDLSPGMCSAAAKLAELNGVSIKTHVASSESLRLAEASKFDVIYAGNMLHHVDIESTLEQLLPHLASGGKFVSWDPIAYNPIINVYRKIAMEVRTEDEHPLARKDIKRITENFDQTEIRFFWLTTLIIFVIMALIQFRNPNKERYWKTVVQEAPKWRWLYEPLEKVDTFLIKAFPPIRWLCWNAVIIASKNDKK